MLLIVLINSVIVIIGVISIMSAFAKSVKEAGTLVAPIMIIVMVIGITAMFGDGAKNRILLVLYTLIQQYTEYDRNILIYSRWHTDCNYRNL